MQHRRRRRHGGETDLFIEVAGTSGGNETDPRKTVGVQSRHEARHDLLRDATAPRAVSVTVTSWMYASETPSLMARPIPTTVPSMRATRKQWLPPTIFPMSEGFLSSRSSHHPCCR